MSCAARVATIVLFGFDDEVSFDSLRTGAADFAVKKFHRATVLGSGAGAGQLEYRVHFGSIANHFCAFSCVNNKREG